MSFLLDIAHMPEEKAKGSIFTAREISQQPDLWQKVLDMLEEKKKDISGFLDKAGACGPVSSTIVLTGAGSSDFIGRSVASSLRRRLSREVMVVPTTHFVTHPSSPFCPRHPYLVIHFARSGDSPESLATYRFIRKARPDARHIVITCNGSGALHQEAARDGEALLLCLPPDANDRSLAMTSSFTSMALCAIGLGWMEALPELRQQMAAVQSAVRRILERKSDVIQAFSARGFTRACYLGSDALEGVMHEGALKMLEMTAGRVVTRPDSFLGVRHGPQVFIDEHCIVVACLSSVPAVRRYEMDLLGELRAKRQGGGILAISVHDDPLLRGIADQAISLAEPGQSVAEELRILTDIVVCQILAFAASRGFGLMPDNPSPGGLIHRVVEGVRIYED